MVFLTNMYISNSKLYLYKKQFYVIVQIMCTQLKLGANPKSLSVQFKGGSTKMEILAIVRTHGLPLLSPLLKNGGEVCVLGNKAW